MGARDQEAQAARYLLQHFPGSPFADQARQYLLQVQLFRPEWRPDGLSNLTRLVTSLLITGQREETVFGLIQQAFRELKDYRGTIRLVRAAEEKGLLRSHAADLDYMAGISYYYLWLKQRADAESAAYLDSARVFLLRYLPEAADPERRLRVSLLVHDLSRQKRGQQTTLAFLEEYDFLSKLLRQIPAGGAFPVRYRLARLLEDFGKRVATDSIRSAVRLYSEIITTQPASRSAQGDSLAEAALFRRAGCFLALADTAAAVQDYQQYLQRYSDGRYRLPVLWRLAEISRRQGKDQEAIPYLREISEKFYYAPAADSARLLQARALLELNQPRQALEVLQKMTGFAHTADADYWRGVAYQDLGQFADARRQFQRYLRLEPAGEHQADVFLRLGQMARKAGQRQEAEFYFSRFLNQFPSDPRRFVVLRQLADDQFSAGNYSAALRQYQALLQQTLPPREKLLVEKQRILCLIRLGRIAAAIRAEKALAEHFPESQDAQAEIEYELGNYNLQQKSFDTAEKIFKRVASKFKRTEYGPFGEYGLGKLYLMTNHDEKGLQLLTRLVSRSSGKKVLGYAYLTLGDYYYKNKQFDNAIDAFKKALAQDPPPDVDRTARRYLIKLYSDVGLYDSAILAVRQYLKRYPNAKDAFEYRIQMGIYLINLNEYGRAIEHLRRLLPQANNDQEAEIRYWIAKSYYRMGQFRTAISEYLKVTYLTRPTKLPWHVTAEYESGLAYMKLKEWDRAREMFRRIVRKEGISSDFGKVAARKLKEIDQLEKSGE